jgi:hypothetical protein
MPGQCPRREGRSYTCLSNGKLERNIGECAGSGVLSHFPAERLGVELEFEQLAEGGDAEDKPDRLGLPRSSRLTEKEVQEGAGGHREPSPFFRPPILGVGRAALWGDLWGVPTMIFFGGVIPSTLIGTENVSDEDEIRTRGASSNHS